MNEKLSRRKAIGAIGGAVLLAGCSGDFDYTVNRSNGSNETQEPKSPSGVEYEGTHESHYGERYDLTIVDRVDNAQMCGVQCTVLVHADYRESWAIPTEVSLYFYSGNDLVAKVDRDLGKLSGGDDDIEEFVLPQMDCEENIDSFKLAVHDEST